MPPALKQKVPMTAPQIHLQLVFIAQSNTELPFELPEKTPPAQKNLIEYRHPLSQHAIRNTQVRFVFSLAQLMPLPNVINMAGVLQGPRPRHVGTLKRGRERCLYLYEFC